MKTVLGIHAFIHDSGACIARDGEVFAISQERLDRVKRSAAFPAEAVRYVLSAAGIGGINEVDVAVFDLFERQGGETLLGLRNLGYRGRAEPLRHHDAHAASAYFASPFDEAAVLVVDGAGSNGEEYPPGAPPHFLASHFGWMQEVQSFYRAEGNSIILVRRTFATPGYALGIGFLYGLASEYLGFDKLDGGKLMGLASYGRHRKKFDENLFADADGDLLVPFRRTGPVDEDFSRLGREIFAGTPPRGPEEKILQAHSDLAFFVQKQAEKTMLALARRLRAVTGSKNLCLAGGVALNGPANMKILQEAGFDNVFIQPASNDSGIPLGCALHGLHSSPGGAPRFRMKHAFLGREYSTTEIESALRTHQAALDVSRPENTAAALAASLAAGETAGLFHGPSEFGPRALGARSILADPRRPDMKHILNSRVKFREPFRPYAPAVLEERAADFFFSSGPSPFMLLIADARPGPAKKIPAAVHADGTARLQTVDRKTNPRLYSIVREFDRLTGIPMVLNTSMNTSGEPVAESPEDAVNCLLKTGLDCLAIGDFLVRKKSSGHTAAPGRSNRSRRRPDARISFPDNI